MEAVRALCVRAVALQPATPRAAGSMHRRAGGRLGGGKSPTTTVTGIWCVRWRRVA